jgi:hypothetical protein
MVSNLLCPLGSSCVTPLTSVQWGYCGTAPEGLCVCHLTPHEELQERDELIDVLKIQIDNLERKIFWYT